MHAQRKKRRTVIATFLLTTSIIFSSSSATEATDTLSADILPEVVVTGAAAARRVSAVNPGVENIELSKMALTPALFGETDLIKSVTLMPGVQSEGEGGGGFEVRGGNSSQNLIMLDGITLYNPSHVMGVFSTFNDNAIGRATLYKGPIPATFGGASSAVLDTSLAPGDMETFHASASVGILAAKAHAEGPLIRERASFAVSARRSYVDLFLKMIPQYRQTVMNFFDVTAKLRFMTGNRGYVDVAMIASRDNMCVSDIMEMHWGNAGGAVNWHAASGDSWRFITSAAVSCYTTDMGMSIMDADRAMQEYIRNYSVNERIIHSFNDDHQIEGGFRSELLRVKSGEFVVNGTSQREIRSGWENALWLNYDGAFGERIAVSAGIRLALYTAPSGICFHDFTALDGPEADFTEKTYFNPQPRISVRWSMSPSHSLKAGAAVSSQNIHALRSGNTSVPFDRYALTSAFVKPETATQWTAGYTGMTDDGGYDWSAECYYKRMDNVYDYIDGCSMFSQINLESIILGGEGKSLGIELMVRKNNGKFSGWIAYTLSKTRTRITGINGGEWYDAGNDRPHHLTAVGIYRLSDNWTLSASWMFASGQPLTAPDVKYEIDGATCYYYSSRNSYRTPPLHRLDLSASYTRKGRHFTTQWAFGIYNAYCRYNPFMVYFEDAPDKASGTRAVQQALFGILPSVSYTLRF